MLHQSYNVNLQFIHKIHSFLTDITISVIITFKSKFTQNIKQNKTIHFFIWKIIIIKKKSKILVHNATMFYSYDPHNAASNNKTGQKKVGNNKFIKHFFFTLVTPYKNQALNPPHPFSIPGNYFPKRNIKVKYNLHCYKFTQSIWC